MSDPVLPAQQSTVEKFEGFIQALQVEHPDDDLKVLTGVLTDICKAATIADIRNMEGRVNIAGIGKAISALAEKAKDDPPAEDEVGHLRILTRLVYLKMLVIQKEAAEVKSVNLSELIKELSQLLHEDK